MTGENKRPADVAPSADPTGSPQANSGQELRQRAEKAAREKAARSPEDFEGLSPEEVRRILHELQVHQVELEMQNDELHRVQQELEASREKYFDLYDMAPVGYFTVGEKGLVLEANLRGARLLGVERSLLVKSPLTRYVVPEDQDIYYLHRKRLLETGARQLCELRMCRQDGFQFWGRLEITVAPGGEDGSTVSRIMVSDITEKKRDEDALRQSEERYRATTHSATDAIVSADSARNIVGWNRGAETIFGYSEAEVTGQPVTLLMPSRFHEEHLAGMARVQAGGESHVLGKVVEMEGVRKDGSEFPIEFSLAAWHVDDRRYFTAIIRDVTERKRAEAENEKLQTQLQQAQKMEAVGRLAGGVAHDFNNLLTVINGYSDLLLQKIAKESPMHWEVKEIQGAGERAATLTRQLLAFSRKQIIEPKVLDLNLLIADLGKMLVRLIGENIDLKIVPGKGLGLIRVDPGQFEQVLINIAVNARDAMPDGGTVLVETANVELDEEYCAQRAYQIHSGRYVRLAVSDTGCGMTGETSKQIFEPFFTTKATGKGTGLGLSMIYGAVKQSGGLIEAYSEVGKGTTFKIYLPRVEGEAVRPEKDARPAVLPGGTETVLLVEDEEIVRTMCSRILLELGYKVLQARNGTEGIALAQGYGEPIDLLLTDVVMPGMNGSELATKLVLLHPEMKILFMSGYTDDAISRHGVLDEGVSFIGKPYTPSALAKRIREVLDKV